MSTKMDKIVRTILRKDFTSPAPTRLQKIASEAGKTVAILGIALAFLFACIVAIFVIGVVFGAGFSIGAPDQQPEVKTVYIHERCERIITPEPNDQMNEPPDANAPRIYFNVDPEGPLPEAPVYPPVTIPEPPSNTVNC